MIRIITIVSLLMIFTINLSTAQEVVFKVELSSDTVWIGSIIELKYTVENGQGDFEAPEFDGLRLVSGPNVSSQFSMINGQISQKASYSYFLEPLAEGKAFIGEAGFNDGTDVLVIGPIEITVVLGGEEDITLGKKYGFSQIIELKDSTNSKLDSLKQKLKKVKTRKI